MKARILIGLLALTITTLASCQKELDFETHGSLVPLTVIENPALPSITVMGIKLHAQAFGDPNDPMLVAIHGGPGADYRGLLNFKQLANEGMYVVFYDQQGSGLSQRIAASEYKEVQSFIDELGGVIDHYRQDSSQKVILAGHSWGAMLATAYINQNPNRIAGAILAEPGGFTWEQTETYISLARKLKLFDESTNDFVYQDQFITGADHNTLDYKMALSAAGDVTTGDSSSSPYWRYGAVCNAASIEMAISKPEQMDFTANLSNYSKKVLFTYSELNPAYGIAHAKLVSSAFPNVQLEEILDCGHEMPQFGWNNLYPLIQSYITEIL